MGHADEEIGDLYSKLMHDVKYRKDVSERVGVGVELPTRLNTKIVSISANKMPELDLDGPKLEVDEAVAVAINS